MAGTARTGRRPLARTRDANRDRNTRLAMAGAFVGALVMLALSTAFSWRIGQNPTPAETAFAAPPGACLSSALRRVPCGAEHELELAGSVPVTGNAGEDAPLPAKSAWMPMIEQQCTAKVRAYLGGRLDPAGKYSVGGLTPTREQWEDGERTLRCALQHVGVGGTPLQIVGSAKAADQSDVYTPGTCLGINPEAGVGDPVDCAKPHAYEILGQVDLAQQFTSGYPSESKQSDKLPDLCKAVFTAYYGGGDLPKGLALTWDTRTKESWDAGSKRVDCKVAGELSKGAKKLQPVVGSIRNAGQRTGDSKDPGNSKGSGDSNGSGGSGESDRPSAGG